nr:MAG TPA: hypothetical protein [Caudoviricetes sp.]
MSFFTPVFCLTLKNKKIVEGWVSLFFFTSPPLFLLHSHVRHGILHLLLGNSTISSKG